MAVALTTLVSFTAEGLSGPLPSGPLVADAQGNLFGVTGLGGANGYGMVFEIAHTKSGYASLTPSVQRLRPQNRPLPPLGCPGA